MLDYSWIARISETINNAKAIVKITVVGFAFTTGIFVGNYQTSSKQQDICWQENYGWCQEGLDWDNVSEEVQEKNDMLCQEFTKMYCSGEISNDKYRQLVENLQQ